MPTGTNDYLYKLFRKIGLSDFGAQTAQRFIQGPLEIIVIVAAAIFLSRVGGKLIRRSVHGLVARSSLRSVASPTGTKRAETLAGVAASLVRIAIWTTAVLIIIDKAGIDAGPLLAGASIVGVAVGFGAQSLVKDFLSGFFVLAEDQYGVGDLVTISDVTGTVEEVNLRVTRLRSNDGTVWFVPNGEIRKVGNAHKEWSRAIVDVVVPAYADVTAATSSIADEVNKIADEPEWADLILDRPEMLGVESIGADGFTVRVAVRTKPAARASVARQLRTRIGERLHRDGIGALREQTPGPAAAATDVDQS